MGDEDHRTIWCGNLNEKVTEDLLYELFLQGGPVERVTIPKDRNGKNRPFAFVTYKHKCSVQYALELFDNTTLFNRQLSLKPRDPSQYQPDVQFQNYVQNQQNINQQNINQLLQFGNQMLLNNFVPNMGMNMYNMYPNNYMMPNQQSGGYYPQKNAPNVQTPTGGQNFQNEDRRNNRSHPYYYGNNRKERDHDNRDRDRDNRDRDSNRDRDNRDNRNNEQDNRYNNRSHSRSKHPSHNSNKYNNRRNYR